MDQETRPCPTCGQAVDANATVCGYCGHDFTGRIVMPSSTSSSGRSGFGGLRAFIIIMTLIVTGGTLAIFLMVGSKVGEVIDDIPDFTNPFTQGGDNPGGGQGGGGSLSDGPGAFKTAKAVAVAMNKNGLKCKNYDLVTTNTALQAGTCFAGAAPLTIQVFYDQLSYDAVVNNYRSNNAIHVAYGTNWTVIAPTPKDAKRVAKALDGKVG